MILLYITEDITICIYINVINYNNKELGKDMFRILFLYFCVCWYNYSY